MIQAYSKGGVNAAPAERRARGGHSEGAAVIALAPDAIAVGARIGFYWVEKARALGAAIRADGQNDPIKVARADAGWVLVAGLHRLRGVQMEGIATIDAIAVAGSADDLRRIELSENIHRRDFGPIERARYVHALAEDAQRRVARDHAGLSQQQIAVRKRWALARAIEMGAQSPIDCDEMLESEVFDTQANIASVYGWQDVVASALGLSLRAVRYDLALYRALIAPFPDLAERLARHRIGDNAQALRAICALPEAARGEVISLIVDGAAHSVGEAIGFAGIEGVAAPVRGAEKITGTIRSSWQRLGHADRRAFLPDFVSMLTPGLRRELRDLCDAAERAA